ncbi:DUF932 domain-containing protein [Streptomyces vilmorinianum]|uniref:DUF932 domain-containing protein n=1 Tax=Streptomyces vilmorinianum TaxID=3051092 RepID=UPI0010FB77F9|nr:DUF932 domain-containing protein [Streptomyces vilmorinianum]
MSTIDVNQQFNDQRRALIKGTRARRRTDGSYVATVGYDDGEVVGRDGLDTTRGTAALYTSTPAWHRLGAVVPGGISDIDTVLRLGQIDFAVTKQPAEYTWGGTRHVKDDAFVTVRGDTGDPLGIVGSRYQPFQQRQVFDFLEDLADTHGVLWESAGALRGGRRVFVTMQIPESVVVDRGGLDDEIRLYVVAINSHDGSSQMDTLVTPWRVVCGNTERFALRDARYRWSIRHTAGALDRLEEARRTLGLTVHYGKAFETEETALARTDLAIDEFHRVLADLWPLDDDATDRSRTIAAKRTERLDAMFRSETERAGRTAYAGERAITDYLDHIAPRRPGRTMTEEIARATALMEDTDGDLKTKAHQRLMLLRR